jgi:FLVCR family MFS transporter 7
LLRNKHYLILLLAFSVGLGMFNALITLLYQLVEPRGYSNDQAGYFGAVLISAGLVGAAFTGT